MDEQLALLHVERRSTEPSTLTEQLRKLLQFAVDNNMNDATLLLRGIRDGQFIVAPNAEAYRVDL